MSVWRRLRMWLYNWRALTALAVRLSADLNAAMVRDRRRGAAEQVLRQQVAELRLEAQSLDAANEAVIAQNRRERLFGNQLAHRNRLGHDWARQNLPPEQAAELCAVLAPTLSDPKETTRV